MAQTAVMDETTKSALLDTVIALATGQSRTLHPTPKYGGTVFLTDPDKQGSFVGGVFASADHVSVEFSKGADFDDPDGLLMGKGKTRRHVKLTSLSDVEAKNVDGFLKQAIK